MVWYSKIAINDNYELVLTRFLDVWAMHFSSKLPLWLVSTNVFLQIPWQKKVKKGQMLNVPNVEYNLCLRFTIDNQKNRVQSIEQSTLLVLSDCDFQI